MQYIFILGTNSSLSIAEILAKTDYLNYAEFTTSVFLVEFTDIIDTKALIKELGGTIKIARVLDMVKKNDRAILGCIGKVIPEKHEGKYKFGFSYYGKENLNTKRIAMETKKLLKNNSISCRWVTSKEKTLSSVVIGQNKLDTVGMEVILVAVAGKILVAKTETVQDYKTLSFRDYNRPARDDKSGMLPPKLAQIMINLARPKNLSTEVLLDPFCGSGTVLMEAVLMGFKKLIGSDLSQQAVDDTRANTEWVKEKFSIKELKYTLHHKSAAEVSQVMEAISVDYIVTEPYLGPQRGRLDVPKIKKELESLYTEAIVEFKKILKDTGRIVMLWPVIKLNPRKPGTFLNPNYSGFKIVNPLPDDLQNKKYREQSSRGTIIYGREGQRIWREIVVLEKQ